MCIWVGGTSLNLYTLMPVSENVSLQVLSGAGGLIDEQEQSFHYSQEWYPLTVVKLNALNFLNVRKYAICK